MTYKLDTSFGSLRGVYQEVYTIVKWGGNLRRGLYPPPGYNSFLHASGYREDIMHFITFKAKSQIDSRKNESKLSQ